jgi:hypothetical protein
VTDPLAFVFFSGIFADIDIPKLLIAEYLLRANEYPRLELKKVRTNLPGTKQRIRNIPAHMNLIAGTSICTKKEGHPMFLILAVVLVLLWLGGFFVLHVSSFLIHLLLIFALISIIMNFVSGRRAV